jgi:hypothetical protein
MEQNPRSLMDVRERDSRHITTLLNLVDGLHVIFVPVNPRDSEVKQTLLESVSRGDIPLECLPAALWWSKLDWRFPWEFY